MDCRLFRNNHASFVDDTLSGVAMGEMRAHLSRCMVCKRYDARLRRGLMVARSAPELEPSPDFHRRLAARIAAERLAAPFRPAKRSWAQRSLVAAGVVVVIGGGAFAAVGTHARSELPLVMAPILVVPPAVPAEPMAAPAMFATVSSSLPVYPAVLLAQRATEQFAATRERTASYQAAH